MSRQNYSVARVKTRLQRRWHTPRTHSRRNGRSVPKPYGGTQSKNGIANGYTA